MQSCPLRLPDPELKAPTPDYPHLADVSFDIELSKDYPQPELETLTSDYPQLPDISFDIGIHTPPSKQGVFPGSDLSPSIDSPFTDFNKEVTAILDSGNIDTLANFLKEWISSRKNFRYYFSNLSTEQCTNPTYLRLLINCPVDPRYQMEYLHALKFRLEFASMNHPAKGPYPISSPLEEAIRTVRNMLGLESSQARHPITRLQYQQPSRQHVELMNKDITPIKGFESVEYSMPMASDISFDIGIPKNNPQPEPFQLNNPGTTSPLRFHSHAFSQTTIMPPFQHQKRFSLPVETLGVLTKNQSAQPRDVFCSDRPVQPRVLPMNRSAEHYRPIPQVDLEVLSLADISYDTGLSKDYHQPASYVMMQDSPLPQSKAPVPVQLNNPGTTLPSRFLSNTFRQMTIMPPFRPQNWCFSPDQPLNVLSKDGPAEHSRPNEQIPQVNREKLSLDEEPSGADRKLFF